MKHYKHIALLLCCSLLCSASILPAKEAEAAKIKLNKTKLKLTVKQSYKLKLKNCKKKIKWKSSKKKVATVSSKGKVKAKKAGKATITAQVGKKKYKCKVTVKKAKAVKKTQTPNITKAPQKTTNPKQTTMPTAASATPTAAVAASQTPAPTATPALTAEELAKNVSVESKLFPEHIILELTNQNSVWLDSATAYYNYYDIENIEITAGSAELYYIKPGETRYISIPVIGEDITLDMETSTVEVAVTEPNQQGVYSDQTDKLEITAENFEADSLALTIRLKNHSPLNVKGSYAIQYFDKNAVPLDMVCNNFELEGKEQDESDVEIPNLLDTETGESKIASYTIYQYVSYCFEEVTADTILAKGISTEAKKLADCILLQVTNANTCWLSSVDIHCDFYNSEDVLLSSGEGQLLSIGPGETQYMAIAPSDGETEEIDLDLSVVSATPTEASGEYQYQITPLVSAEASAEENGCTITFTNQAALEAEASYIVYFRDADGQIISAIQDTMPAIPANDAASAYVDFPILYDTNGEIIPIAAVRTADIQIYAHTLQ